MHNSKKRLVRITPFFQTFQGGRGHVLIKKQIEEGDGLPDIASTHHCLTALKKAGFEILEERDLVNDEYGGWQVPATGEYATSKDAKKHYRGGKPW
jgi:hypothetical protein